MCKLKTKSTRKTYTGYKVAYKYRGRYYSPATGIIYKPGSVTIPKVQKRKVTSFNNVLSKSSSCYVKEMVGRTCVYRKKRNATDRVCDYGLDKRDCNARIVVLKMTIRGDLMNGVYPVISGLYLDPKVVGGKEIVSMEEVKI